MKNAIYEAVMSIKRAGATIIITYFAKDIAKLINTKNNFLRIKKLIQK